MTGFQKQVNVVPAPGVPGRFASANPRVAFVAGPGGLVAGPGGVKAGGFCWAYAGSLDVDSGAQVVVSFGAGPVLGFVANESQGLITTPFSDASMTVPQGFMVTAYTQGDFWVQNSGTTQCVAGQKAYANLSNGSVTFAATGSPTTGGTSTASSIAAGTWSATGSISGNVLSVTALLSGTIQIGSPITGGGSGVVTGSVITQQLTGTIGGVGTYALNYGEQTAASQTINGTYGILTVGGTVTGSFGVGDTLSGSGVAAGSTITALGTGTGGAGTYIINLTQTVGSEAINAIGNVETKWIAMSGGLPGEFIKISSWPLG